MACRTFSEDGKVGIVCDMKSIEQQHEEHFKRKYGENYIKEYKEGFMQFFIDKGKSVNQNWEQIAKDECEAHLESHRLEELNFEAPCDDAEECMSYWAY